MFGKEPVVIAGAVRAIILAAVAFGLELTPEQIAATMLAVEAVLTLLTRQSVTATATLQAAGLSKAEVVQRAEANKAA
jgi:hypothetical protein